MKCAVFRLKRFYCFFNREELKEQLEKKKKGSRALADFEDKMNEVCIFDCFDYCYYLITFSCAVGEADYSRQFYLLLFCC